MHSTVWVRRLFFDRESELAHDAAGRQFDVDLLDQELSGHRVEHLVGRIALVKQHVALPIFSRRHERLQPVHRQVALGRHARLLHQVQHLVKAEDVDRQREQIEKERRHSARQRAVADEEQHADDAEDAQRHDRPHHQRGDVKNGADQGQRVGDVDVGQE